MNISVVLDRIEKNKKLTARIRTRTECYFLFRFFALSASGPRARAFGFVLCDVLSCCFFFFAAWSKTFTFACWEWCCQEFVFALKANTESKRANREKGKRREIC